MKSLLPHFILVAVFLLQISPVFGQRKYPNWFLHPQQFPNTLIGYSTAGVVSAEKDAVWRYSFLQEGYLSGTASYFNGEDKWEKKYISEAQIPLYDESRLIKIASITTSLYGGGEEISLFSTEALDSDHELAFKNESPSATRPDWVDKGPFYMDDAGYYGVGQYVLRGNENDAWRTAEERSLIEIATVNGVEVDHSTTLRKSYGKYSSLSGKQETINILTYTFNHQFQDAKILERWVDYPPQDSKLETYIYILMNISSTNIKHNLVGEK